MTVRDDATFIIRAMLYAWLGRWVRLELGKPDEGYVDMEDEVKLWWEHVARGALDDALIDTAVHDGTADVRQRLTQAGMSDADVGPATDSFVLALRRDVLLQPRTGTAADTDAWMWDVLTPEGVGRTKQDEWLDAIVADWPEDLEGIDLTQRAPMLTDLTPLTRLKCLRRVKLAFAMLLTDLSSLGKIETLEELEIYGCAARDLGPLARLTRLRRAWLDLEHCDLSPFGGAPALERLDVTSPRPVKGAASLATAPKLRSLHLSNLEGPVDWLASMKGLRILSIQSSTLRDASPLAALTQLRRLKLDAPIEDVGFLDGLGSLVQLELAGCEKVRDITPIASLASLEALYLGGVPIESVEPLSGLKNLGALNVSGTKVSDLSPLRKLERLRWLVANGCELPSFESLEGLHGLEHLRVNTRLDPSVEPISRLTDLEVLDLHDTQFLEDIRPLRPLTKLKTLNLGECAITDISALAGMRQLESLNLSSSRIRSVEALAGLPSLVEVDLEWCQRLESIAPLARCPRLERIYTGHTDALVGPKTLRDLGGAPTFDVRNHIPLRPPHGWTVAQRTLKARFDMCVLEVDDEGNFHTAIKLVMALSPPPVMDKREHVLLVEMARRDAAPIDRARARRVLKELRACGPFTELADDHPMRKGSPNLRAYTAVAKAARRMSWGAYENRAPLLVIPSCEKVSAPAPNATYDLAHHLPDPTPADWEVVHRGDGSVHYRGDDAGVIVLLQPKGDGYELGIGLYPAEGEEVVPDLIAKAILASFRARGEIEETPFGPNVTRPGMRTFEAVAWPV